MLSLSQLISKIKEYNQFLDESLISKAYNFSKELHNNQKRHSGDPYFSHPVAVAEILADLKLDQNSIAAALMHDIIEDTEIEYNEVKDKFGKEIADLVEGVTKLGKIKSIPNSERFAENFKKFTIAMSKDIRVLLIKLADRYHNMKTIDHIPQIDKRIAKATESIEIYAPLAGRIGLNKIKDELYDMSFNIIDPQSRQQIKDNLDQINKANKDLVQKIINKLSKILKDNNVNSEIFGRTKTPYSIWKKIKTKNIEFYNLHDIMAFRIITQNITECYKVLGVINSNFNMIPGTFKDYISTPKDNGYKSIHLATIGPHNQKIELQIRDKEMHQIAEFGLAAHWQYKEYNNQKVKIDQSDLVNNDKYRWIRDLIYLFENSYKSSEVLKEQRLEIHQDEVFCFTPNGDIFNLPKGSSIIDFAYAIHSHIGNKCSSAKVNGVICPLKKILKNGDQVEIITSKNNNPSANWLNFVVTSKAKSSIRSYIRKEKFNEYKTLGHAIISRFYSSKHINFNEKTLIKNLDKFNKETVDDLYVAIAEGLVSRYEIIKITHPDYHKHEPRTNNKKIKNNITHKTSHILPIEGLVDGMSIHLAGCCNPIPGDLISGVINTGSGVTIHNRDCKNLLSMSILPQRIIDVCWKDNVESKDSVYPVTLKAIITNKLGSLAEISSILARKNVNINNINIINRTSDFFELNLTIETKNSKHLSSILSSLRISDKVLEINKLMANN
ncbi:bifunctional (p)ppGpp synthetase/guanosine-3',5'-bis(diphosphate) 3'-pyrophosphohydrolase [Rickettsiales bacterium]|nr:bifunctional (p)ppGpp synthetase/guanosine-3',5'-bis(diphosphate) 3'-pyrophosphohydrolase [Rickettsiales bacterium]